MKELSLIQLEQIEGKGWGMAVCKVGFGVAGALLGGPYGLIAGGIAGNIFCISHNAY